MRMPIVDYRTIANAQSVELTQLREQNRVLRDVLKQALDDIPGWVMLASDALTATSQPQRPRCEQCGRLLIHEPHDPTCLYLRPATSQEGQHGSR